MKVRNRNTELPVKMLYPHPDNPRKNVGDVTELAESIKANGIFQNLTVVIGGKGLEAAHPHEDEDGYTVIIGHRRLAAAKLAGLEVVPCMVVEMDEREQAATMLLENMQRADLTVYEQAQGFQMMLDLGETQDGIAEKTGFSKTTIRHRLKLLELDPEEFAKAQERQATFGDYMELEKIKDPVNKTAALKAIGTSNFKYTLERLITRENAAENVEKATALLDSKLKKISFDKRFQYRQLGYTPISKALNDDRMKEIDALIEKGAKYYAVSSEAPEYAWAYIYADAVSESEDDKAARQKREEAENARRLRVQKIIAEEQRAHDLRERFVKSFANSKYKATITEALLIEPDLYNVDYGDVAGLLGIDYEKFDDLEDLLESPEYRGYVKMHSESVMLAMLYTIRDGKYRTALHDFSGKYQRNTDLENWYDILSRVGYKMSGEERDLLAGTHECFGEKENYKNES